MIVFLFGSTRAKRMRGQCSDTAKGVVCGVTNTLGNVVVTVTGMVLGWWDALFR